MYKRGFSHIEVVIAFVFFISVVVFSLYFLGSFNSQRSIGDSLENSIFEVEKKITTQFSSTSVKLNGPSGIVGISLNTVEGNGAVVDKNENLLESEYDGGMMFFDSGNGDKIYTIRFSNDIIENKTSSVSGAVLQQDEYNLGSITNLNAISEAKADSLLEDYLKDYQNLKEEIRIGKDIDFGFIVEFDSGEKIVAEKPIPEGAEVFIDSKRVEILRKNGVLEFANLGVSIW